VGYTKYWDKKYYKNEDIYQVNLEYEQPKVMPVREGVY